MTALAPLVYLPAERMYEQLAHTRERALGVIEADLRAGTLRSTWVAELDGRVAGAMVAYPFRDDAVRVRSFLRALVRRSPPWRWPAIARLMVRGHRTGPRHPYDSLYVDGLASDPAHRRRGVATALLELALEMAVAEGLSGVALDTAAGNEAALALYRRAGFEAVETIPAKPPLPAVVVLFRPAPRAARLPRARPVPR
jgi:ribosomal protein S18 acetylase RimI-like enzyme